MCSKQTKIDPKNKDYTEEMPLNIGKSILLLVIILVVTSTKYQQLLVVILLL